MKRVGIILAVIIVAILGWQIYLKLRSSGDAPPVITQKSVPVVVPMAQPDGTTNYVVQFKPGASLPEPAALPEPTPIQLREHKLKGTKYHSILTGSVEGTGRKDGFKLFTSGVDFLYQTEIVWDTEVLENDGTTIKERRFFTKSRATSMLSITDCGLTSLGVNAVKGGLSALASTVDVVPGVVEGIFILSDFLKNDKLVKIPYIGSLIKDRATAVAKNQLEAKALQVATKLISQLENRYVVVTWQDGKMTDCRAEDGGILTEEDKEVASKAAVFADFNFLPADKKEVGQKWVIAAKDAADFFHADSDVKESVEGKILLVRDNDVTQGRIARVNGKGNAKYQGDKISGDCTISQLTARLPYGTTNNYLQFCESSGEANYVKVDAGHLLFGLKTTAKPKFTVHYECDQK